MFSPQRQILLAEISQANLRGKFFALIRFPLRHRARDENAPQQKKFINMQTFVSYFLFSGGSRNVGRCAIRRLQFRNSSRLRARKFVTLAAGCMVRFIIADLFVYGDTCSTGEPNLVTETLTEQLTNYLID